MSTIHVNLFDDCEEIFGPRVPLRKVSHYEREALENRKGASGGEPAGAPVAEVKILWQSRLLLEGYEERAIRLAYRALQWAADSKQHEALGFAHPWDLRNAADVMGSLVTKSEKAKQEAAKE